MFKVECTRNIQFLSRIFQKFSTNTIFFCPRCPAPMPQIRCEALWHHLHISYLGNIKTCLFKHDKRLQVELQEWMLHYEMRLRTPERTCAMLSFRMDVALLIAPKHLWEMVKISVWTSKNECCTMKCSKGSWENMCHADFLNGCCTVNCSQALLREC